MKQKPYRHLLYFLLVVTRAFFSLLPYTWAFAFGGFTGRLAFRVLPKERNKTIAHLKFAFGEEKSGKELSEIALKVFEHYGRTAAELAMIDKILPRLDEFVTAEGLHYIDEALKKGKGVVGMVAHFGNWELHGGYLALKGYPLTAIVRKLYFEKYDCELQAFRKKMKVKTIYRDASVREMLGVLKKNEILVIAADQDVESVDGVFADFFGKPAFTPMAPARFTLSTGAVILPAFMIREGIKHRLIVEAPVELVNTGHKEADIKINTQRWVAVQEKYIRRYPHLWVWNHRRWKTKVNE